MTPYPEFPPEVRANPRGHLLVLVAYLPELSVADAVAATGLSASTVRSRLASLGVVTPQTGSSSAAKAARFHEENSLESLDDTTRRLCSLIAEQEARRHEISQMPSLLLPHQRRLPWLQRALAILQTYRRLNNVTHTSWEIGINVNRIGPILFQIGVKTLPIGRRAMITRGHTLTVDQYNGEARLNAIEAFLQERIAKLQQR